jgi:hypothetical protein
MAEHRITLVERLPGRTFQPARRESRMTARDALMLSTIAFLALAALTVVAGVFVVFLSRISERDKDRDLAAYQTAAELRIHSARADAADALDRALAREGENTQSRERTAMLAREAAALLAQVTAARAQPPALPPPATTARAAEPPVERTADGRLSAAQRGRMIAVLIRRPGDITVMNATGADAERQAADIRAVFSASGWKVESGVVVDPKIPLAPLSLVLGASEQDKAVRTAFQAAGLTAPDRPRSPMDRPSTIYVGS